MFQWSVETCVELGRKMEICRERVSRSLVGVDVTDAATTKEARSKAPRLHFAVYSHVSLCFFF